MKDFDSLVGIWNEQKTAPVINYKEVINHYKNSREKFSFKLVWEIFLMLLAFAMIAYIFVSSEFQFWTSYVGLGIVAICCIYFIIMQLINIKNISNSNTLFDKPQDHILFIQKFRASRYTQNTRNYKLYSFCLTLGLVLFLIEYIYTMNIYLMIGMFIATIAWFVICYIYLMKMYIRKEEKRFNEMLADLERLNEQFKDVE
ncbi:MAG: hypothetical protein ABIP95_07910 [Pelobium sp.]